MGLGGSWWRLQLRGGTGGAWGHAAGGTRTVCAHTRSLLHTHNSFSVSPVPPLQGSHQPWPRSPLDSRPGAAGQEDRDSPKQPPQAPSSSVLPYLCSQRLGTAWHRLIIKAKGCRKRNPSSPGLSAQVRSPGRLGTSIPRHPDKNVPKLGAAGTRSPEGGSPACRLCVFSQGTSSLLRLFQPPRSPPKTQTWLPQPRCSSGTRPGRVIDRGKRSKGQPWGP